MPIRAVLPDLAHWKSQVKCQVGCPVATDSGRYVQLIAEGRDEEAYLVARAPNPFASVCGRVCAAPCEDACRRGTIDAPVSIRALKRFVTEQYGVESIRPDTQDRLLALSERSESPLDSARPSTALGTTLSQSKGRGDHEPVERSKDFDTADVQSNRYFGHLPLRFYRSPAEARTASLPAEARRTSTAARRRVAVVGAGPAGLSAAHDLALLGYDVTVFEAGAEPGGMMRFGIPEYRLPRALLKAEIDRILALGAKLELNSPLGPGFGLAQLRAQGFEAIFLSVGVMRGRDLQVPGVQLDGVVKAVDYLLNINRGFRMDLGRRVVVIGGGFVAFDAARTALRISRESELMEEHGWARMDTDELRAETDARVKEALDSARAALRGGATEVTVVSLENFSEMPVLRTTQGHEEFAEAQKEGVRFVTRRGPRRFLGDGHLKAVELRGVDAVFDEHGRFAPRYADEDTLTIDADACILAIGQQPDLSFLTPADGVELTRGGTIKIDPATLATSAPGIYAGGDVAFGPRNLIDAVANGKGAARSMHEHLAGRSARLETELRIDPIPTGRYRMLAGFEKLDREAPPTLDLGRRTGIAEVETGYDAEAARRQAARCLVCHVQTIYDPERCVLCNRCVDVCPEYCLAFVPLDALELPADERAAVEERAYPGLPAEARAAGEGRAKAGGFPLAALIKDDARCIRCGLCAIRCPTEAMTMERFSITEAWAAADERAERPARQEIPA